MHDHTHQHEQINYNKRFLFGIVINIILVVAQIIYGIKSNSVALISDAFHNAGDVLGLVIAWGGFHVATLAPTMRFTYGFKNTTIIAAFVNAVILFMAIGGICWEAILRFNQTQIVNSKTVIIVAFAGVLVNGITAVMFLSGNKDINIRGAFLHMAADAAISCGVIIGAVIILYTGWMWIDPLLCIGISLLILLSSWGMFRESINLILHAVPEHIDIEKVRKLMLAQKDVTSVHDLHIWAISTSETALSVHIVTSSLEEKDVLLRTLNRELDNQFHIHHTTIQIEHQSWPQDYDTSCN